MAKPLYNTFRVLHERRKLTVGYFGGSITEGSGASDPAKSSWRALTTSWFRRSYPECEISEIQAAIGGTGSDLGVCRCRTDLLSGEPDLVFIEFAVNDYKKDEDLILRSMEGIVRQIWNHNADADIVFVYTITKVMAETYEFDSAPDTVVLHQKIADFYAIPSVNLGKKLWQYVGSGSSTWEELLPDAVHPSDKGYQIYADEMQKFLSACIAPGPVERKLDGYVTSSACDRGRLVDAWELLQEPWEKDSSSLARRYPHMLVSGTPGAELHYTFQGSFIGLYWLIAPDSGDIEWSVDGSKARRQSSWDKHALKFTRAGYCILDHNLDPGEHVLTIKVLQEKQPQSEGNWIRIGAVLVD
ncbi:SGNH/GDSL hydrolase family protein [Paenibacillus sp. HB172176]|uniref:SGNH/GDSL hydrolase family protein n=1 Tax=Paenibacillus sp. HB172176 TaxID=2493690 RepID=UPI00143BDC9D|nr:SGNH/GDSL hydrolase family protein [Paenibacillus sp. HB172176]